MLQAHRLLVVVADPAQQQHLQTILEFLNEDADYWLLERALSEPLASAHRYYGVLLGASADTVPQVVARLEAEDPCLPIVLLGGDQQQASVACQCVGALEGDLVYTRLVDMLHRLQSFRAQAQRRGGQRSAQLFERFVGNSQPIQWVREMMAQVADKDVNVMITGESGTGKEVVARSLHDHSRRSERPFVPVNCGAIPAELMESELFGHEKGAFTGAISTRIGRFELAEGGTLFLDEIGDMPLHMQVKLLRVLQERCFERVGSNRSLECDVRIIAATHKNLEELIEKGEFREDLYYRLNVFPIEIPALRQRTDDIPLLVNRLVGRLEEQNLGSVRFSSAALLSLSRHEWPGNVRELSNLIERLAILYPDEIVGIDELPPKFRHLQPDELGEPLPELPVALASETTQELAPAASEPVAADLQALPELPVNGLALKVYMAELEAHLIGQALADCNGVVARAAERLQVRRTTLVEKMRKYGLQRA